MLGLLLIYFVGKAFYELAHEYEKSRWGFAILGVLSYYIGTFVVGLIIGIISEFGVTDIFNDIPDLALGFIVLPFGVLACWGLYRILENQWSKQPKNENNESLDSDFIK